MGQGGPKGGPLRSCCQSPGAGREGGDVGGQEDGLAGSVQNQEQDGGERKGMHSLRAPTFSQIPPNPVGRHMGEPHFYRCESSGPHGALRRCGYGEGEGRGGRFPYAALAYGVLASLQETLK